MFTARFGAVLLAGAGCLRGSGCVEGDVEVEGNEDGGRMGWGDFGISIGPIGGKASEAGEDVSDAGGDEEAEGAAAGIGGADNWWGVEGSDWKQAN